MAHHKISSTDPLLDSWHPPAEWGKIVFIRANDLCSPEVNWGHRIIDGLVGFMGMMFPDIEVYYALEDAPDANAWVARLGQGYDGYMVCISTGALELFHARIMADRAIPRDLVSTIEEGEVLERIDGHAEFDAKQVLSFAACAALLGHELGHVHEGQLDMPGPTDDIRLVSHAAEIAADAWAIRVASQIVKPIFDAMRSQAPSEVHEVACSVLEAKMILYANGLLEDIDLRNTWTPKDRNKGDEHPVGAARFLSTAVALIEWKERTESREMALATTVMATGPVLRLLGSHEGISPIGLHLLELLADRYDESKAYIDEARELYERWMEREQSEED